MYRILITYKIAWPGVIPVEIVVLQKRSFFIWRNILRKQNTMARKTFVNKIECLLGKPVDVLTESIYEIHN